MKKIEIKLVNREYIIDSNYKIYLYKKHLKNKEEYCNYIVDLNESEIGVFELCNSTHGVFSRRGHEKIVLKLIKFL